MPPYRTPPRPSAALESCDFAALDAAGPASGALVGVVDDDVEMRGSLDALLRSAGYAVQTFVDPSGFLAFERRHAVACLVLDVRMGDSNGLDFQQQLLESRVHVPVVLISGYGDVPSTVRGMRAGAVTFLAKPFPDDDLLAAVAEAVARHERQHAGLRETAELRVRYDKLTPRERDVLGLVVAGLMNKQVASRLNLSVMTVKIHRGNLMRKMAAQSLADLVRMAESLGARAAASRFGD